jgi:hypothetical protein
MHTDIHALSEIRSHDPSVRAREDGSWLRPRGHCDWRKFDLLTYATFSEVVLHGNGDVNIRKAGMEMFTLFSPSFVILSSAEENSGSQSLHTH